MDEMDDILQDTSLENVFREPEHFREQVPDFAYTSYSSPKQGYSFENIRLVGKHPLWGQYLWNGAVLLADILSGEAPIPSVDIQVHNNRVLELGAGAAVPSLMAALRGASHVLITDYPDKELVENIKYNVTEYLPMEIQKNVKVEPFQWGDSMFLVRYQREECCFDKIFLADLISNHYAHHKLLLSCKQLLKPDGIAYVCFSHHRPHVIEKDLNFFHLALSYGLKPTHRITVRRDCMFPSDIGSQEIRSQVHLWTLCRKEND
ncbi:Protein N-methyltransferase NNT1 [Galdieria sulphuraria]|uniref:Nicotinamide n-methyltransferase n=1 Tax=Galdieria sulphuraria TaxID=130081 RepID=M2X6A7_GALSU|nr:nicotinamide n-methyltransferase [Galdieria sulphuraria]EME32050.1 nicotinamide n-methyltransferase [Galdieria sulphuraria]GJD06714.1 Protein N-methyltransferase NNT1 [Galdieria sulphuraria]|eukprot:XP_005708570.1 nicotinamide n-methyltransferase [Galdieria sulphuraria]